MGLFFPKTKGYYYPSAATFVGGPRAHQNHKDTQDNANMEPDEDVESVTKKVYDKEKAVHVPKENLDGEPETETELNTRLNALLYHTSNDSIDLYRLENNSLDLLGRMYYDDYDINDKGTVERVSSLTSMQQMMAQPPSISQVTSGTASPALAKDNRERKHRPLFERGVSFDTLDDSHHQSITLKVKHPGFKFRRNNKTYLIGFRNDAESLRAVEWAFQEMVIHGDTIIVLQVLDDKSYKFVDPVLAEMVLEKLEKLNTYNRKISMVYEVVIGRPQKLLKLAIEEYKPAMMIVGTHQYGQVSIPTSKSTANLINLSHGLQPHAHSHFPFLSKASISKYFLMYALVPVILVKPFYQHQERLKIPIDSEKYFEDLVANIDVTHTREKKKKSILGFRSPSSSRNTSSTNLTALALEDRGRSSESNSFTIGSRDSSQSSESRLNSQSNSRSHSRSLSQSRSSSRLGRLFSS